MKWKIAQFLERRWWKRYLSSKDPALYLASKRKYWQSVLDRLNHQPSKNGVTLDAGCGPAGVFILLHDKEQMTALDPLLGRYEQDLAIFNFSDYPAVTFHEAALESAVLPAGMFTTIYCFNAINHVEDWELALDQLTTFAANGATMIISSDVHRRPWLKFIFRLFPGDLLHPQQHNRADYREALRKRGWQIEAEQQLRSELIFEYVVWKVRLNR